MAQSNTTNLLLKLALVGGAGFLGYMAYAKKALPPLPAFLNPEPATPTAKPVKAPVPLSDFPLKKGSRGQYVRNLQLHLGVGVDGIFGNATEAALQQRYGKKQVTTLSELNAMIKTGTAVATRPATKPSLPASTAKPATPSAKPVVPVKPVVPAKKPASAKPAPATPAPAKPAPSTPAATAYQKTLTDSMWKVFSSIWSKTGGSPQYTERFFGDWKTITPILSGMNDANLKGFINAYGRSFQGLQFAKEAKRTGTLLGDLQRIKKDRLNAAYFVQLERVKRLS